MPGPPDWSEMPSTRGALPYECILTSLESITGAIPRITLRTAEIATDEPDRPKEMFGRYELLGKLGEGGMGAVLRGRDADLDRDLAIKVLLEKHDHPELVRRFVEEAQIAGQLQHPGIVPVYELGQLRRRPALLRHEARQGPHPGRAAGGPRRARPTTCPGSSGSSSRSARRWPTPTPGA